MEFKSGDKAQFIGESDMKLSQRDLPLSLILTKGVVLTVDEAVTTSTGQILRFKEVVPWLPEALFVKS